MEDIDFDGLLEELQQGQSILIMGPEAHLLDKFPENDLPSHFSVIIKQSPALSQQKGFNLMDGFFLCNSTSKEKPMIFKGIKDYYRQLQPPQFYQYLAALPFSMVISLSPDNLMEQVMRNMGYEYDFAFYKKGSIGIYMRRTFTGDPLNDFPVFNDIETTPSAQRPLLFNMLGYYEFSDSLLFTYESLFEYLYSNFPVDKIPARLRSAICNASSYIFVGFGYHQWYLKIIFFMLEKIISTGGQKKLAGKAIFNYGDTLNETIGVYEKVFPLSFYKNATTEFSQKLFTGLKEKTGYVKKGADGGPYRILFVASLPDGKMPLRQNKEWKDIRKELAVAEAKGQVELKDLFCAQVDELILEMNKWNPDMLVLSMHGKAEGLFFEDAQGDTRLLELDLLKQNLQTSQLNPGYRLKCIFFGACHSATLAQPLADMVDYTIGMEGPILDDAVRLFSQAFFSNFPAQRDYLSSVETGKQILVNSVSLAPEKDRIKFFPKNAAPTISSGSVRTSARG